MIPLAGNAGRRAYARRRVGLTSGCVVASHALPHLEPAMHQHAFPRASLARRAFRKLYRLASPSLDRFNTFMPETTLTATAPSEPFARRDNLIVDLGMHDGSDTLFYLKKGFNVVAVEANPILAAKAGRRFHRFIRADRLRIVNKGVTDDTSADEMEFYLNHECSEWSSFVREIGSRDGTRFSVKKVRLVSIADLFREFGTPYYLKVDIEGFDERIARAVGPLPRRPRFISVEEGGVKIIDALQEIGAAGFKLVSQAANPAARLPFPALEGRYCRHRFVNGSSGPFGDETPGEWRSYSDFRRLYLRSIRASDGRWLGPRNDWFDVHAKLQAP
jgi:FkbM family methyltransferase